jgi:ABC-type multidrug transport system fused ATPase/permease subunit
MARRRRYDDYDDGKRVKFDRQQFRKALRVFKYIRPYNTYFFGGLALLVISSLVFMVFPVAAGELLNIATDQPKYGLSLQDIAIVLVAILVMQSLTSYIRVLMFAVVSEKGMADIRKALYGKLISLPITFFEKNRVGDLTSRSTADVQQLQDAISVTLAEFLRQIITLLVGIGYLFIMTWQLAIMMLSTLPVVIALAFFFGRYIRKLSKQRQDELAETNTITEETLQTINVVKSFTNEWFEAVRYGRSINKVVATSLKYARVRGLFIVFIITGMFGVLFFVLYQGAAMVESGTLPVGDLATFIIFTGVIGGAMGGLGDLYTQLVRSIGATERIMDILDMKSEVNIETGKNLKPAQLSGDIIYNDIQFAYPTRDDIQVLKSVNLHIREGETVALVGASGSGKSTIVQLLMRFYNINSGTITIGNTDIRDYEISKFRKNIAIVPQEVLLFGGTIKENIAYGKPNASEDEIIEAAQQANAWEFINGFPEGLDTVVGERGIKLSGGQRQRVAIARAILRNPSILILDEATSSLDAESEKVVQNALNRLMEGRTSIVIAHRLATIRNVDCIYVLDNGEIVEQGTHDELSNIDGTYSTLAKLQFDLSMSE